MSVLIKGMNLPKGCLNCHFVNAYRPVCVLTNTRITGNGRARLGNCPLVKVPQHGRLIDADELRQSLKDSIDACSNWADEVDGGEMYARVSQALGTFVECSLRVKAAPTIIEAEGSEEHDKL